jgi:plastocyanin
MSTLRPKLAAVLCGTALLASAAVPTALARDNDDGHRVETVRVEDRCDPATFNPAGVLCTRPAGGGNVTLQQLLGFIAARPAHVLEERDALGWRFKPDEVGVKPGTTLHVTNLGGEVHTFTNVTRTGFTLGCVGVINQFFANLLPPADPALCNAFPTNPALNVLAPKGANLPFPTSVDVPVNGSGTLKFQCMIHPWMRTTVKVEGRDRD